MPSGDKPPVRSADKPGELLAQAGFGAGDFLPVLSFGGVNSNESSTSSTYTTVQSTAANPIFQWDDYFTDQTVRWRLYVERATDGGDQIDVRIRNTQDNETVVEALDVGSGSSTIKVLDGSYTPTSTNTPAAYFIEIRNADNTTTIELDDPTLIIGVQL